MIPRIIHYCWFGPNKIPEQLVKYMESWRLFCPDYEIKLWNLYIKFDELLIQSINNLRGLIYEFLMYVQDFKGFLMVWNTLENTEQLVNLSLHELKDINKRKEVAKDISKGVYLLLGNIEIDKDVMTTIERITNAK